MVVEVVVRRRETWIGKKIPREFEGVDYISFFRFSFFSRVFSGGPG